jgi:hypothetical protein
MMLRFKVPALFAALLYTGFLGAGLLSGGQLDAQTPDATVPEQGPPPVIQRPAEHPDQKPLTPEQRDQQVRDQSERVTALQATAFGRQLGLTPAQVQKLKPILAERQKELRALVSSTEAPNPERRAKMQQVQAATQVKIENILDPTQKMRYRQLIAMHTGERTRRSAAAARRPVLGLTPPSVVTPAGTPASPDAPAATPAPAAPPAPATPPQAD